MAQKDPCSSTNITAITLNASTSSKHEVNSWMTKEHEIMIKKPERMMCGKQFSTNVKTDSCSGNARNGKFEAKCQECKRFVP